MNAGAQAPPAFFSPMTVQKKEANSYFFFRRWLVRRESSESMLSREQAHKKVSRKTSRLLETQDRRSIKTKSCYRLSHRRANPVNTAYRLRGKRLPMNPPKISGGFFNALYFTDIHRIPRAVIFTERDWSSSLLALLLCTLLRKCVRNVYQHGFFSVLLDECRGPGAACSLQV